MIILIFCHETAQPHSMVPALGQLPLGHELFRGEPHFSSQWRMSFLELSTHHPPPRLALLWGVGEVQPLEPAGTAKNQWESPTGRDGSAQPLCSQDLSDKTPQQKMWGSHPFPPLSYLDICVSLISLGRNWPQRLLEHSCSMGRRREFVRADVFKPLTSVISVEGHSDVSLVFH